MTSSKWHIDEPRIIIGYTTNEHLLLDLDHTSLYKVTKLVQLLQYNYPELGNVLVMRSSIEQKEPYTRINRKGIPIERVPKISFHVIFNNSTGYAKCRDIIETMVTLNILPREFRLIRAKRGDMTLRVSPATLSDRVKPAPTPWRTIPSPYNGKQDGMIKQYLAFLYAANNLFKG